jgi:putative ABC transport system permease protein
MLKNYFLVALRNFWRNKAFSAINILGLAIGISAAVVIFLIVDYDFTFDHFEKDRDRIFRVVTKSSANGEVNHGVSIALPLVPIFKKELLGTDLVIPFSTWDESPKVSIPYPEPGKPLTLKNQEDMIFADRGYFDMIQYDWLAGSPKTALDAPYQVVLTESRAKTYYPGLAYTDIIGKPIVFNDSIVAHVTGIVKNITYNTDFYFKGFVSRVTLATPRMKPGGWDCMGCINSSDQLFVRLAPGVTPAQVTPTLNRIANKYNPPNPNDHSAPMFYDLQPFSQMHFQFGVFDNSRPANKSTLYGLLAVAAFLLLLACINFINLSTAQSSRRAKEIGIRKTLGSQRRQLTFQFLVETFLLTCIATFFSILFTPLLLHVFADFIPPDLHPNLALHPEIILFLIVLVLVVTLLSGFYPALVMSGYKPLSVLKNQASPDTGQTRSAWFRKSLTVSQFVIAQVFIIGTLLISKQISYALNTDYGFKRDAILYFYTNDHRSATMKAPLLYALNSIPGISRVSLSSGPPSSGSYDGSTLKYTDGKKTIEQQIELKWADTNYLRLYGLHLLAGANIPQSDTTNAVIINNSYAHLLGFQDPRQAVGKYLLWNDHPMPIVGVVADFHQKSLHESIQPLLIANGTTNASIFNVALQPQNADGTAWSSTVAKIEQAYKSIYPEDDFRYRFEDETIAKYYIAEKNVARLLFWATGLTIFISCLGLLGLAIYITNQRKKEIGIRKVIGATVTQLVVLISKDFMLLIGLAILIALPIAWWGSNEWLKNFAYKTSLSWWVFAAGGAILIVIALFILCLRTFRAASANPVDALRSE